MRSTLGAQLADRLRTDLHGRWTEVFGAKLDEFCERIAEEVERCDRPEIDRYRRQMEDMVMTIEELQGKLAMKKITEVPPSSPKLRDVKVKNLRL